MTYEIRYTNEIGRTDANTKWNFYMQAETREYAEEIAKNLKKALKTAKIKIAELK